MDTEIFPKGQQLPKEYFSGNAFLTPLVAKDKNNESSAAAEPMKLNQKKICTKTQKEQFFFVMKVNDFNRKKEKLQ